PLSGALNHNGGVIAFGPDKKLYAVVGENANIALAQDPLSPMGKVLRMNSDATPPSDSPFHVNASWNPYVYTCGPRNSYGLTFHRLHLVPPNYDSVASDTPIWVAPDMILDVEVGPDGAIWFTTPSTIYRYWDSGQPPVASFTAAPNPTIVGATVTFDASASADPDGQITAYAWNFGDLTLGSGQVTPHSYTMAGTYNVSLTVTDNESLAS